MLYPLSTRYKNLFSRLEHHKEGAFVPFITLGDPEVGLSLEIIQTLINSGADALELGIPFSDPLADGPTLQNANIRALKAGITPNICFDMIHKIRIQYPEIPIGLLVYANLVFSPGINTFFFHCAKTGVDSVLIADIPIGEAAPFQQAATQYGIHSIYTVPPNIDQIALKEIAKSGGGYTYLVSRSGVTGGETPGNLPINSLLKTLSNLKAPSPLLGFGISEPTQVCKSILAGVHGVISGSAIVERIEQNYKKPKLMLETLSSFIREMKAATHK